MHKNFDSNVFLKRKFVSAALLLTCIVVLQTALRAEVGPSAVAITNTSPANVSAATNDTRVPVENDLWAGQFLSRCADCHSLSGAKLTGPELSHVASWNANSLQQAIKRMEKNVGPLADDQITGLETLLRDPRVRERLKSEEARIQAQFMAKMEPANAEIGKALFLGTRALSNGGIACYSCHASDGQGGNLGPDLSGVFAKMGKTPLISAIEKASFKVMDPHYQNHPVTKQEAMHLAEYFSKLDPKNTVPPDASFAPIGAGAAACMLAGLGWYFKSRRTGRDQHLQRRR